MTELDEALLRLSATGAEWHGGLSNHAPMCVEALHALGRDDAISGWVSGYAGRLEPRVDDEHEPIDARRWSDALGHVDRLDDWIAFFDRELLARDFRDVLRTWVVRLVPGLMAAALHGPIRVAHAARAMEEDITEPRRFELALALGYWAARYQAFAATPRPHGGLGPLDALARMPLVPTSERRPSLIFEQVKAVDAVAGFAEAVDALEDPAASGSADRALDRIIDAAARAYVGSPRRDGIAFLHTVTGPAAMRLLLPYIDERSQLDAVAHGWLAVAAIACAYGGVSLTDDVDEAGEPHWDGLADAAIADGDEHRIKLVEACRREYDRTPFPALVAAARKVTGQPA